MTKLQKLGKKSEKCLTVFIFYFDPEKPRAWSTGRQHKPKVSQSRKGGGPCSVPPKNVSMLVLPNLLGSTL